MASSLRLPEAVCDGIRSLDEHWNGHGRPARLAGEAIPLPSRIALMAQVIDVFHRSAGREAAVAEVRRLAGSWLDPALVAVFLEGEKRPALRSIRVHPFPRAVPAVPEVPRSGGEAFGAHLRGLLGEDHDAGLGQEGRAHALPARRREPSSA